MGDILVAGSIAFDTIMVFNGRFGDHILPDKTHQINVSFPIHELVSQRPGGNAANIAYTLALLGEKPLLAGGVGLDFSPRLAQLRKMGVETGLVLFDKDLLTASAFITTDMHNDQITAFYAGAMLRGEDVDLRAAKDAEYVVLTPGAPDAIDKHIDQAKEMGTKLIFSPGQAITVLTDATLRKGIESCWLFICNDYEMGMVETRLGMSLEKAGESRNVIVTRGAEGAQFCTPQGDFHAPAAPVTSVVDPTGAGDSYLAGLIYGLRNGNDLQHSATYAAIAAAYTVEINGTQEHVFDAKEFNARLEAVAVA